MSDNHKDYRRESRKNYGTTADNISLDQLNAGSFLRIADATEAMAKNFTDMQRDLDWYKKRAAEREARIKSLERTNANLKGQITKLKKKNKS